MYNSQQLNNSKCCSSNVATIERASKQRLKVTIVQTWLKGLKVNYCVIVQSNMFYFSLFGWEIAKKKCSKCVAFI